MQELFSHREIRPCNNSENLELFDQEKKNIFRYSDHKKKRKQLSKVGSDKLFVLSWPASITT